MKLKEKLQEHQQYQQVKLMNMNTFQVKKDNILIKIEL